AVLHGAILQLLDRVALILFNAVRANAHIIVGKISFQDRRVSLDDSDPYLLFQPSNAILSPGGCLVLLRPSGTAQGQCKDETTNPNPIHVNLHFVFGNSDSSPGVQECQSAGHSCTAFSVSVNEDQSLRTRDYTQLGWHSQDVYA